MFRISFSGNFTSRQHRCEFCVALGNVCKSIRIKIHHKNQKQHVLIFGMSSVLFLTIHVCVLALAVAFDHSLIDQLFSNSSFATKLPAHFHSVIEHVTHGDYISLKNQTSVFQARSTLMNYPKTYTKGYARVDYIDALTKQFVQASIFELGVCARYRRPVARSFWAPDCCPFVKGMKFRDLVIRSATEATMTFDYYREANCLDNNGQPTTARTIVFPTAGGAQPTSTPVPLIYNTYHVPGRPRAIWIPPASSPGYFLA